MYSAQEREVVYMKEFMKQIRMDLITSSIICIIFGIVLIARPIETVSLFCRVLAIIMIVVGGMFMFSYFLNWMSSGLSAAMGLIVLLIGVWIFINPGIIETLIPVVIGVILLCHGIQDVRMSWQMKEYGQDSWKFSMVLAVISVIFGVLCIIDAFMVDFAWITERYSSIFCGSVTIPSWIAFAYPATVVIGVLRSCAMSESIRLRFRSYSS